MNPERSTNLIKMTDRHQQVVRLLISGLSNIAIADMVGMSPQQISNIKNSEIIQTKIQEAQKVLEARFIESNADRLENLSSKALDMIQTGVFGEDSPLALHRKINASFKVLSHAGYAPHRLDALPTGNQMTQEEFESIKRRSAVDADYSIESVEEEYVEKKSNNFIKANKGEEDDQ